MFQDPWAVLVQLVWHTVGAGAEAALAFQTTSETSLGRAAWNRKDGGAGQGT